MYLLNRDECNCNQMESQKGFHMPEYKVSRKFANTQMSMQQHAVAVTEELETVRFRQFICLQHIFTA